MSRLLNLSHITRPLMRIPVIQGRSSLINRFLSSSSVPPPVTSQVKDGVGSVRLDDKSNYEPKPWTEASSLIIAARVDSSDKSSSDTSSSSNSIPSGIQKVLPIDDCDYRLLMAKRSGKSSFMANAFVFPGGYVDLADFSTKWWAVFEAAGMSRNELSKFGSEIQRTRPPIFTEAGVLMKEEYLSTDILPATVALRITAIRETFEETGILLLNRAPSARNSKTLAFMTEDDFAKIDMKSWRTKIHENPVCFADFCLEIGLCPDIWALNEWWNWLTPNGFGHKRFDTMFYTCCLDYLPKAFSDDNEVSKLEWVSPLEMLEEHIQKRAVLAPPQVYELSRISNFNNLKQLKDFAVRRERLGVERWCPNITRLKDGAILTLPGDEFFEKPPEVNPEYLPTLEEMRIRSKKMNRIELRAPTMIAVSNVKLDYGHVTPIAYPPVHTSLQSNL